MTTSRLLGTALSVVLLVLFASSLANAQATRTWVSGVGDDANPCSRTAPCKTFAGAISKTAVGGEIDCIDPGGFGAVTITKSITIDGGGTFASILGAGTNGIIISDSAVTPTAIVTIRNLSIDGAGTGFNGIRVLKAKIVYLENLEIFGFTQNGIDGNLSAVATGGSSMFLDDVNIQNLSGVSSIGVEIHAIGGNLTAYLDHVRAQRLPTGVHVNSGGFAVIRDSEIVESLVGIEMVNGANARATIENTVLSNNSTGISAGSTTTTFLSQSTITGCTSGISNAGGTVQSSGNNRILGNVSDGLTPTIVNPK